MRENEDVAAHLRQLSLICLAIPSGVVIFAGVVWYLLSSGSFEPPMAQDGASIGNLLNLIALSTLIVAHFLPVLMKAPGPGASRGDVLAWHRTATIVAFAVREAAAFMALVGGMLTGELGWAFAVAGLAIVAMIGAWPRASQLEGPSRR